MSTSRFLDAVIPLPAPPEDRYIWAVVTQASPLRIKVDGDLVALGITPDTLVYGLTVGQRVYCQIINRRLVILGASGGVLVDATPAGAVMSFAGATAPEGYLLCDGAAVSRTTYAALYAALGGASSPYGQGNGSTTFNLPNLKGRVPVGRDSAQSEFNALGETGGSKTHTLSTSEMPGHTHSFSATTDTDTHNHGSRASGYYFPTLGSPANDTHGNLSGSGRLSASSTSNESAYHTSTADDSHNHSVSGTTGSSGSGGAHNNLQPYLALNFIIKT